MNLHSNHRRTTRGVCRLIRFAVIVAVTALLANTCASAVRGLAEKTRHSHDVRALQVEGAFT